MTKPVARRLPRNLQSHSLRTKKGLQTAVLHSVKTTKEQNNIILSFRTELVQSSLFWFCGADDRRWLVHNAKAIENCRELKVGPSLLNI